MAGTCIVACFCFLCVVDSFNFKLGQLALPVNDLASILLFAREF